MNLFASQLSTANDLFCLFIYIHNILKAWVIIITIVLTTAAP